MIDATINRLPDAKHIVEQGNGEQRVVDLTRLQLWTTIEGASFDTPSRLARRNVNRELYSVRLR